MTTVVMVDTNVVSYRLKGDTRGELYTKHLIGRTPAVSFITVAELYRWAIRRSWGERRIAALQAAVRQYLILPLDDPTAWEWARIPSVPGRPIDPSDAWIAASALRHAVPLLTHNRSHFEHVAGLTMITEA